MAGVVVSASTGVMSSLLSKLSVLLSDKYKQLKGLRKDIEFLSHELSAMNAALEKLAGMDQLDSQKKLWRNKIREMAYDTEDCIDTFMHQLDQEDGKDGLFHKTARKIRKLRVRYQMANKIQEIKASVEEQSQRRERYKIDEPISMSTKVEVDPRVRALFVDPKMLVGIDGPQEQFAKWLMEGDHSDSQSLKVMSIVGFGGLGKTTLANQVYTKIKHEFACAALVPVSKTPHMPTILKDILSKVVSDCTEMEDDITRLIKILRKKLKDKRYLIVIDDLWSITDWRNIECALEENNNGSRVIVTTRIEDVASACCSSSQGHVYKMQPLNELHSRRLFFKRVFGTQDCCPPQFKEISEVILRKCKGVPLAITSIASLLANQTLDVEIWEKISNLIRFELDTKDELDWMKQVLNLSYNDLSFELKTCFLYLGTYPEDYGISKFDLMRKWIAEGFVVTHKEYRLDLEEVAENYFNELINRSMIQPYFSSDSFCDVLGCRVHDLMLDLIILKSTEENFFTIIDRQFDFDDFHINGASQARRISHQFNNQDMASKAEMMNLSKARSYSSFLEAACMPPLSRFIVLRVLHMDMGHSSYMMPESTCVDLSAINHLFLLRYIVVRGFCLELPKKFGKLKQLMTLDMAYSTLSPTSNQSSDFTSLSSLRHLDLRLSGGCTVVLRNGLSTLCNLRTLSSFDMRANSIECIGDLGVLTDLRKLDLLYHDDEETPDTRILKYDILAASLDKLGNNNLREFTLSCMTGCGCTSPQPQFWSNCFTRPRHLQNFSIFDTIPKVPKWLLHADRLAYLFGLQVEELWSDDVQVLAQLPCLIHLDLQATTIPEKDITFHPDSFPSLKHFKFSCELLPYMIFEPAAMPRLQELQIYFDCREHGAFEQQEDSPLVGIEHLASVEHISVNILPLCEQRLKMESAFIDNVIRHPKHEAIEVNFNGMYWMDTGYKQSLPEEEDH